MDKKALTDAISSLGDLSSQQLAFTVDAQLLGQPVAVTLEKDDEVAKLEWTWDLTGKSSSYVLEHLLRVQLDEPSIPLGKIRAAYLSGKLCKGLLLDIGEGDLGFLYVKQANRQDTATCWGMAREKPIDVPTSDLVAKLLGDKLRLRGLRVGYVSGSFNQSQRREVAGQFALARILLGTEGAPPNGFVAGVTIEGLGALPIELPAPAKQTDGSKSPEANSPTSLSKEAAASAADSADDSRKWFAVGKSIGPLRLDRVGCEWKDSKIGLLLDGSIDAGPLHLGLTGLAIRVPPSDPQLANLETGLDGIDVSYTGDPITISGGLFKSEILVKDRDGKPIQDEKTGLLKKSTQYDGAVLLKAINFAITGLGSYALVEGEPSFFVYAILHAELGGPPCFRVNGLAAGFGYNRKLILPPIEEVHQFPLVRAAMDPTYLPSGKNSVKTAMEKLRQYIPPSLGNYWFAIGIRFNSFGMLQSFALLSVSFGQEIEIGLMGMSTLTIPRTLKESDPALAYAELALKAVLRPLDGTIKVEGRLTSESYIFSKDCHITGGFAFYVWFSGPHEGDFVLTLGGYHPKFRPLPHYPLVPRLGINWQVTKELAITAEMYFALTPTCLMAGGRLSVVYRSGRIRAWFIAYADFLLSWKPFYYAIDMGISIGVEADLWLFSIRVHLNVALHIWGPEFAGVIEVDLYIVSFAIHFGAGKPAPKPIGAVEFVKSFLPDKTDVIETSVTGGLIRQETLTKLGSTEKVELRVVNAHALELKVQSVIPVRDIAGGIKPKVSGNSVDHAKVGIKPMGKGELKSELRVTINGVADNRDNLTIVVLETTVPDALWGAADVEGVVRLPNDPATKIIKVQTGISISFAPRRPQGGLPRMPIEKFKYEDIYKPVPWKADLQPENRPIPSPVPTLADLETPGVKTRRDAILRILEFSSPFQLHRVNLSELVNRRDSYFQFAPESHRTGEAFN